MAASAAPLACEYAATEVCQVPLVAFNALAYFLCLLLAFCEVGFDFLPMTEVVSDDRINPLTLRWDSVAQWFLESPRLGTHE